MKNKSRYIKLLGITFAIVFIIMTMTGCGSNMKNRNKIRIGYMPVYTSAALIVASEIMNEQNVGLQIELIEFTSARDSIAALKAKQIDGLITDSIVSIEQAATNNLILIGLIRKSSDNDPMFAIFGKKTSTLKDIVGKRVAVGLDTVSEYALDQMLQKESINLTNIEKVNINDLTMRLKMLENGSIEYIVSTTTYTQQAIDKGFKVLRDDSDIGSVQSYIALVPNTYNKETLNELFENYNKAVVELNDKPEKYKSLLNKKIKVPNGYDVLDFLPKYALVEKPDKEAILKQIEWLTKHKKINAGLEVDDIIDSTYWK